MSRSFLPYLKLASLVILLFALIINSACLDADMTRLPDIEVFPKSEKDASLVPLNQQADGSINPLNLAQALAFAINGDYKVEDIFRSLPASSHTGVSLEDFRAYIKALTPAAGKQVSSLVDLSPEATKACQDKVLRYQPHLADLAITSRYYRFNISPDKGVQDRQNNEDEGFVLAIQVSGTGAGFLSPSWLKAVVEVQDFASFYFAALEDEAMAGDNTAPLAFLLGQDIPAFEGEGLTSYYETKAEAIRNYYLEAVTTLPKAAQPSCLLPGYAAYLQDYRYAGRLSGIREVEFYAQEDSFRVVEPISESLHDQEAKLLIYDLDVWQGPLGNNRVILSSEDVHPLLGPLEDLQVLEASEDGKSDSFRASYYGISFILQGRVNAAKQTWQGWLEAVEVDSQIFSLGSRIHVGMSLADFYLLHPFYLDNDRILRMNTLFPEVRLDYEAADGLITKLILTRAGT